jgi:hypothetical protein
MSIKCRHLLLLFYKISIPICVFLSALQNLKNASAVEISSRSSQPASHGFLVCFVSLLVVTSQGDLSRARTSGSLRGPNPDCRVDGRAVPSRFVFLCTRKQTENTTGTKFPISQNLHHLLDRMVPHSKLRCSFSDCYNSSCLVSSSTFCMLRSVAAVLGRPQRG